MGEGDVRENWSGLLTEFTERAVTLFLEERFHENDGKECGKPREAKVDHWLIRSKK